MRFTFSAATILCLTFVVTTTATAQSPQYTSRVVVGWTLLVRNELLEQDSERTEHAVKLLQQQLEEIIRVVPKTAVAELQKVRLYFCPEYPGMGPRAEYHPSSDWLTANGRDPEMAKAVEFTNTRVFEEELSRMPNFALHELAHALHDRVLRLGFENPDIQAAFDRAKSSGRYDNVERRLGNGRKPTRERAYAMTTPQEYFAECSEACFSTNDFFPFNREQLQQHDPEMLALVLQLWNFQPGAEKGVRNQ